MPDALAPTTAAAPPSVLAITPTAAAMTDPDLNSLPRPAATLVVVRDSPDGIEVLLSRRAERGDHNSGAWVFPGGMVHAGDRSAHACCTGLDDATASARLGVPEGGLDYVIAAVRECFEESGLLFAHDASGALVRMSGMSGMSGEAGDAGAAIGAWRGPLHRDERSMADLCCEFGLRLALGGVHYLSHWVTPAARIKRFDTRFFIAAVPQGQTAAFDGTEMVEQRWLRPADAVAEGSGLKLLTPTRKTLELISRYASVEALLEWAGSARSVPLTMPRMATGSQGTQPVTPDELAYAEIGRLDPEGAGTACYDIQPGVAVRLSARVIRVTANNGSVMTGPGTNTYLVGGGTANEWAVIDPGPLDLEHIEAILKAAPGPVRWIFVTHTHRDHSPAAMMLAARTGGQVLGALPDHAQGQDASFEPDELLAGGERIALPGDTTLHVIHTPGHASNHLCYLLEEEKLLFTGDHVMQASTVVIDPPDGNMAAYVDSLRALTERDLEWLAPGHGFLMAQPREAMQWIIDHRLRREAKVLAAVQAQGPTDAPALLATVYADVPERMHPVALRSLTAHLIKLRDDGAVAEADGLWALDR